MKFNISCTYVCMCTCCKFCRHTTNYIAAELYPLSVLLLHNYVRMCLFYCTIALHIIFSVVVTEEIPSLTTNSSVTDEDDITLIVIVIVLVTFTSVVLIAIIIIFIWKMKSKNPGNIQYMYVHILSHLVLHTYARLLSLQYNKSSYSITLVMLLNKCKIMCMCC